MDGPQYDDAGSSRVAITLLSVAPTRAGKLFALASVAVDIDGVQIAIHNGEWQAAITLPEEVRGAMGDIVLDALIERGLANRRFAGPVPAG